ncbi:MAG: potassium-transporting ATPase subunit KdpA [Desulfobacteraceae bacterium]|jgi:trk system potassium uptake protein TrkH|nr:potassium-transporting ATPase subunit KdpA [Desulfobacteraceae bacterium]
MAAIRESLFRATRWTGRHILRSPSRITIAGFLALIGVGTILLILPVSTAKGGLGLVDALFTATSAVCVTGLVVVDTATCFTRFGQGVLLLLFQVGGLGIMTLSTLYLLMAGRRLSLTGRMVIQDTFTHSADREPDTLLKSIVGFTLVLEALGALVLFSRFSGRMPAADAVFNAVFHAVSAFCNAGFSTFSDSFTGYRGDWLVNGTLMLLIVSGGIGFLVIAELRETFLHGYRRLGRISLHSKIVLSTTGLLLAGGAGVILVMEWPNTLGGLPVSERFLAAAFQSVTARTAGFNTLPIGAMANQTLFVMILLMFVGASPGSCGGGIKTTTLLAVVLMGISRLQGRDQPQAFYRRISTASVLKAVGVVLLALTVIVVGTLFLLMSELGDISHLQSRGRFLELLFEVVSAYGTVGLSMGVTESLSVPGKLVITAIMFTGRLGPLMLALAVSRRTGPRYRYAEERIMVG